MRNDYGEKWKKSDYWCAVFFVLGTILILALIAGLYLGVTYLIVGNIGRDFTKVNLGITFAFMIGIIVVGEYICYRIRKSQNQR